MDNQELHTQKVAILSRLIKESSLTLEEALILLQEEEEVVAEEPKQQYVPYTSSGTHIRGTPNTYTTTYPVFLSGLSTHTTPLSGSSVTFCNTNADTSADLNN